MAELLGRVSDVTVYRSPYVHFRLIDVGVIKLAGLAVDCTTTVNPQQCM